MKSTTELETVVTVVYANQRQMRRTDPLKKYMDVIADQAGALVGWGGGQLNAGCDCGGLGKSRAARSRARWVADAEDIPACDRACP